MVKSSSTLLHQIDD